MNAQKFQIGQMVSVGFESNGVRTSIPAKVVQVTHNTVVVSYERDGIWVMDRIKTA